MAFCDPQKLQFLHIYDLDCGSVWLCVMQLPSCSSAKGHAGSASSHNAWSSPTAYLLITAITTATLVCLFTGMAHYCVCIPLTGGRRVRRPSGEGRCSQRLCRVEMKDADRGDLPSSSSSHHRHCLKHPPFPLPLFFSPSLPLPVILSK